MPPPFALLLRVQPLRQSHERDHRPVFVFVWIYRRGHLRLLAHVPDCHRLSSESKAMSARIFTKADALYFVACGVCIGAGLTITLQVLFR